MPEPRSWKGMWAKYAERLKEQTGEDLATWNARILSDGPDNEQDLRKWLDERSLHGYTQQLLVMERFGYPDFLQTEDEELIDNQYADREHLRPILDELLTIIQSSHPDVEVVGRKTYVPLYTPRRQFAVIKATTRKRVDLGFRLDGHEPSGRMVVAKGLGNETINLRVPIESAEEIDDEVVKLLELAWNENT
jgi:hypothetical protein